MRRRSLAAVLVATALGLAACSGDGGASSPAAEQSPTPQVDPQQPTGWGPTEGELARAGEIVAAMKTDELAGQLIVGRYAGTDPGEAATLVRRHHLAGVQLTSDNIADREQVLATTTAVGRAAAAGGREHPAVIGVDQEGGLVSHLDGIAAEFPSFETAGLAVAQDRRTGRRATRRASRATAHELRELGFTWVFAPVADVAVPGADPVIGSRSPSSDPRVAARTVSAAIQGYSSGGIVSTVKHFPGHGRATADSHQSLPLIEAGMRELRRTDLLPFEAAFRVGAPAVMVGHLEVPALAGGEATSLSPRTYEFLRQDLGFEGVAITDSLGMGAVIGTHQPAVTALQAGADLLLMPADTARTARTVTTAIDSGELPRDRAEEAATRVVAMQLWQQRTARKAPLPADVTERAQQAAAALSEASYQ